MARPEPDTSVTFAGKISLTVLKAAIIVGSLGAVGWIAYDALQSEVVVAAISWRLILGAFLLQITVLVISPLLWANILGFFRDTRGSQGDTHSRTGLYLAYTRSWLARYIPGRIWMFAGRLWMTNRLGIPAESVTRSMALEMVFMIGALTVFGVALSLWSRAGPAAGGLAFILGLGALPSSLIIMQNMLDSNNKRPNRYRWWHHIRRFAHRVLVGHRPVSKENIVWGASAYAVYSCLSLGAIVVLAASVADLSPDQMIAIAGAWALSSTLGYFAVFAPAGLGVRDVSALVLFSSVLDVSTAALIVAASRVMMVVADIAFVGIVEAVTLGITVRRSLATTTTRAASRD